MKLMLENGYEINMPKEKKYNIYYGPNKIGKTQISYSLKKYYEEKNSNVLLFNDSILKNMIIQDSNDANSFEVMPMIQEYNKYKKEFDDTKKNLSIKENLKDLCSTNTKKAFADFEKISQYINDDTFFYKGEIEKSIYTEDELKSLFKTSGQTYNFFEIINILKKDDIKIVPDDLKLIVTHEIHNLQVNILKNESDYKYCPVCYSRITPEIIEKIKKSVQNGSLEENLKESIFHYMNIKYDNIRNLINNLLMCNSYDDFKNEVIKEIEKSIIYYLSKSYDIEKIDSYLNSKRHIDEILRKTKDFKISENEETYNYIKNKFKQHSVYKNANIDVDIKDGKLKIVNCDIEYSKMSKSEQNFFRFLYFDILVYQKKASGNLHIIIDDPFDSYDDIYVQDSIGIIVNLINECINKIDTIDILSHSMYIIYLYKNVQNSFKIYWLDQIKSKKEILVYNDMFNLLSKVEANPYDYGIILKMSEKLVDRYSLIAFATLLRNEINMERLLMEKNSKKEVKRNFQRINSLYNLISDSIDHVKTNIKIGDIAREINELFYYDLIDSNDDFIEDIMKDVTENVNNLEVKSKTKKGSIKSVEKNDICHILVYKILLGIKIRRIFEKKAYDKTHQTYNEVGELMRYLKGTPLYDFYSTYNYIINSFNHSASRVVPPIFVYSIKNLQEIYYEITNIE